MIQDKREISINRAFEATSDMLLKSIPTEQGGLTKEQREKYKFDPVGFSRDILGGDPWEKQAEIMQSVADNERTTVRSSHGIGKTWDAAHLVLWFNSCWIPSTVVTTASVSRQVKDVLWREINAQYAKSSIPLGGRMLTMNWELSRDIKWFATGFTIEEHSLDRFQGFHNENIFVLVDEACGVAAPIFGAIEGLLSAGTMVRLLLIGNPNDENTEFGKSFKSDLYKKFYISAFDLPNFTEFGITEKDIEEGTWKQKITGDLPRTYLTNPSWVAGRYKDWSKDSPLYQVRVKGEFPTEDPDKFIPLSWVERAHQVEFEPSGLKIMGVDIAGLGRDESVATVRQGNVQTLQRIWHKKDPMESSGIIINLMREWEPDIVNIDSIGEGSGVVARLKELGYSVNGVNVGERAEKSDEFMNLRAELYYALRAKLRDGELQLIDDDIQDNELVNTDSLTPTSRGLQRLEPKDDIKKKIGKSPDRADALMLTMFEQTPCMDIVGDIGSIYSESEESTEIQEIYKPLELRYNKDDVMCPQCNHVEGMVLFNDQGMADIVTATHAKCIICKVQWPIKEVL